jgi:imidazoleglycerol-phosphate dehydratase
MDECLARCVIDFSGRSAFRFGLAREFFQGFANEARCNLHLELLYGDEPHHIVEALFKAFARAVDAACQRDPRIAGRLPSTKGRL